MGGVDFQPLNGRDRKKIHPRPIKPGTKGISLLSECESSQFLNESVRVEPVRVRLLKFTISSSHNNPVCMANCFADLTDGPRGPGPGPGPSRARRRGLTSVAEPKRPKWKITIVIYTFGRFFTHGPLMHLILLKC